MIKLLYLMDQDDFEMSELPEPDLNKYYEIYDLPLDEFGVKTPEELFYALVDWTARASFVKAGVRKIGLGDIFNFHETDYCVILKDLAGNDKSNIIVKDLPDIALVIVEPRAKKSKEWRDSKRWLNK